MDKEQFLDFFADRSFLNTADNEYIVARMAYRAGLGAPFQWSALHCIEKYLKCILLKSRISTKKIGHDIIKALTQTSELPYSLQLSESSLEAIEHLNRYGKHRYDDLPWFTKGPTLVVLDKTIWELRRYCQSVPSELEGIAEGQRDQFYAKFFKSSKDTEQCEDVRIPGGRLEAVLDNKTDPARSPLIWKNLYFPRLSKKKIRLSTLTEGSNSPLSLYPEFLDAVDEMVDIPKNVRTAYRQLHEKKV